MRGLSDSQSLFAVTVFSAVWLCLGPSHCVAEDLVLVRPLADEDLRVDYGGLMKFEITADVHRGTVLWAVVIPGTKDLYVGPGKQARAGWLDAATRCWRYPARVLQCKANGVLSCKADTSEIWWLGPQAGDSYTEGHFVVVFTESRVTGETLRLFPEQSGEFLRAGYNLRIKPVGAPRPPPRTVEKVNASGPAPQPQPLPRDLPRVSSRGPCLEMKIRQVAGKTEIVAKANSCEGNLSYPKTHGEATRPSGD